MSRDVTSSATCHPDPVLAGTPNTGWPGALMGASGNDNGLPGRNR
jgi:hypothetical protein